MLTKFITRVHEVLQTILYETLAQVYFSLFFFLLMGILLKWTLESNLCVLLLWVSSVGLICTANTQGRYRGSPWPFMSVLQWLWSFPLHWERFSLSYMYLLISTNSSVIPCAWFLPFYEQRQFGLCFLSILFSAASPQEAWCPVQVRSRWLWRTLWWNTSPMWKAEPSWESKHSQMLF